MPTKKRLYSKREPRLPVPSYRKKNNSSFPLRTINNADQRFAIVKELHRRLDQLKDDAGCDTIQKEWMAARAVFLVARIESIEFDAVTGKEINWREYLMAVRALSDVLKTLGLNRERKSAKTLESYIVDAKTKNGKQLVEHRSSH